MSKKPLHPYVQKLDVLSTRMAEAVDGEHVISVAGAALAVALDAAEQIKEPPALLALRHALTMGITQIDAAHVKATS